jgi:hypothetical protein
MARTRNLKPSFFTNDNLAECEPLARLLFAGLWTVADREGRLEDRPKKIKAELLPYDDCDIESLLNSLHSHGFIVRYCADNNQYIQVVNFAKHQNPHQKENPSTIPAPDLSETSTGNSGTIPALTLNPYPLSPIPSTLTLNPSPRVEGAQPAASPETQKPKSEKGKRLEAYLAEHGVDPTCEEWGRFALTEGLTVPEINDEMKKFRDWWKAAPAAKGVKADWPATWRNWIRKSRDAKRERERRDEVFRNRFKS